MTPILNTAGSINPQGENRTSQIVNTLIPAGTTLPISQSGQAFYIIATSGPVMVRPSNGVFNFYYTGTGLKCDINNLFDRIEVTNTSSTQIAISVWVGFGDYIDNRLIPISSVFNSITFPTYPTPNSSNNLLVPDLSGTSILDQNGKSWLALNRLSIQITNYDSVNAMPILSTDGSIQVIACLPNTSLIVSFTGNYRITIGLTNLNCVVSETYNSIASSFL